jgi:HYR domain-containing protein/VCBS repeat protein
VAVADIDVAVADIDDDGVLDLVTANANANAISILTGAGRGTFSPPVSFRTGQGWAITSGRFDGDARADLALGQFGSVMVLLNVSANPVQPPDVTPPAIAVPEAVTAEATSAEGATVTYTVTASDDLDPEPVTACTPDSDSLFPLGDTTVTCVATDAAGNRATASFVVRVADTTVPSLAVPTALVVDATTPTGADVQFAASATDSVDPAPTVTCIPAAGAFPIGDTTVACTAADAAGNTTSATFGVHVRDANEQLTALVAAVVATDAKQA